ncbi:MAG: hypothetical protein BGO38_04390 [Cellulomonas sp. 73-145]|uniref:DUF4432 family protein n=1 Tax=Cellulomonas sp. 73-145 TaxID=1895739 RepID=UPI0009268ED4|nr:DUF4432 family protein [Cellulomonas sp. 73-145]MBN9325812.1 DUF4432 family protein [Cellulomonas sp.]OJV57141.1 MAG: hypothetical protein BGO38_04390 [Cellulomonas sp. 73-145]
MSGPTDPVDAAALLDSGMVSLPDAVASVDEVTRAGGERVLVVRAAGGLAVDVLPDRGLDLGPVWWGGVPVAWRSPNPVDPGPGWGWEERFRGGLLATCGPDNIGEPRGASGQHGTHHLTSAYEVRWWRERTASALEVHVSGSVAHTSLGGARIIVERHVVVPTGTPWVHVRDVVRNVGDRPVGVPLLYHVNLGAPLLRPGARLRVPYRDHVTREPLPAGRHPLELPSPAVGLEPVVAEHRGPTTTGERASAVLTGTGAGVEVVVEWPVATLPRLNTWAWPAERAWVLGVEPSNAPLFGPERDGWAAGAPVLEPGAEWQTGVSVGLRPAPGDEPRQEEQGR